jgi:hypothetical protein
VSGTTVADLARADIMAGAFERLEPPEQADLMIQLALYDDELDGPDDWCRRLGLERTPESLARWHDLHFLFLRLPLRLGWEEFDKHLSAAREKLAKDREIAGRRKR